MISENTEEEDETYQQTQPKENTGQRRPASSSKSAAAAVSHPGVTPIDLELDLAAQQSKLKMLQDEIDRLRCIKVKLEEAKVKGDKDVPNWFLEEERFQQMLSKVKRKKIRLSSQFFSIVKL